MSFIRTASAPERIESDGWTFHVRSLTGPELAHVIDAGGNGAMMLAAVRAGLVQVDSPPGEPPATPEQVIERLTFEGLSALGNRIVDLSQLSAGEKKA